MDSPNVNLAFQNLVSKELKEKYHTTLTDLGTCSLHSANNGFGKLLNEKDIAELDQMAIDFHFFSKNSTFRREDFAKVTEITSILSSHLEKPCKVLVKLVEQFDNLK